jgi:hypothetical protein
MTHIGPIPLPPSTSHDEANVGEKIGRSLEPEIHTKGSLSSAGSQPRILHAHEPMVDSKYNIMACLAISVIYLTVSSIKEDEKPITTKNTANSSYQRSKEAVRMTMNLPRPTRRVYIRALALKVRANNLAT